MVVKVGEAQTRLSELLHRVEAGEEVILSRGPVAIARLAPIDPGARKEAMVAALRDARDDESVSIAPVGAAELGFWRAPDIRPAEPQDHDDAPSPGRRRAPPADGPFVVEPSFAAAWMLPGPDRAGADAASARLAREGASLAPGFWAGLSDLLLEARRRRRVEAAFVAAQLTRAARLPLFEPPFADALGVETEGEARAAVLRLSLARNLSSADAACLALARASRLPLATNQPALARAAAREGVAILTDLSDADLA